MSMNNEDQEVVEEVSVKTSQPTLYVGTKPLMAYVTSAIILLSDNNRLFIKARGNSIGRAVDISQIIVRKIILIDIKVGFGVNINISSDYYI